MCLNFVRKIGHHRSEMLPGDVARKPAPRALPPSIPRPSCCRIDYTEEEQESGNDVEHKQANPGLLAHSGVKYSTLRSIAVDMIIVFVDESVLIAYE